MGILMGLIHKGNRIFSNFENPQPNSAVPWRHQRFGGAFNWGSAAGRRLPPQGRWSICGANVN
jgi:hypothetical protein